MAKRILLVDDEPDMLFVLGEALRSSGFEISSASDGESGLKAFLTEKPDLLIADVTMPGMSGLEMVRKIRLSDKRTPIFMLTSMTSVDSAISGFESGANDYIRKPFSIEEVVTRAKAATSYFENKFTGKVNIGKYVFQASSHTLTFGDEVMRLSGMESSILDVLSINMNKTVKTEDIVKALGKDMDFFSYRSLQVHVVNLRKLLSKDPEVSIVTERLVGYRLVG